MLISEIFGILKLQYFFYKKSRKPKRNNNVIKNKKLRIINKEIFLLKTICICLKMIRETK